ncbi:MAG: CpsD/CapB family tyrosine-protein kinase [Pontixanthobacter sp.]
MLDQTGGETPFDIERFRQFMPEKADVRENKIVGFDARDRRARAFSLMRTSLSKRLKERGHRIVGLTSATPAAGKSFLSMNLAASLSKVMDDPVYLVDLDLRRASMGEQIGLNVDAGIASYLGGASMDLHDLGYRIHGTKLVVFPTERVTNNSAELVSGARFERFIEAVSARSGSSTVLIDLPPAFASDDTMLIMERLDSYILVVDSGKTTKRHVNELVGLLDPVPCVGTILNRYIGGFGDSYGYGYGDYNKYYD